ncbi:MAG: hypothetical protein V9G24_01225 [Rhodoblastus sp.]
MPESCASSEFDLALRADHARLRAEIVALRLIGGRLRRHLAGEQIGLARSRLGEEIEIGLRLINLRFRLRVVRLGGHELVGDDAELRVRALARDAIGLVVEPEQQIALLDGLSLLHVDFRDDAGDVVCDIDDVGLHVSVVGRGEAAARQIGPEREGQHDERTGEKKRPAQIARLPDRRSDVALGARLLLRRFRCHGLERGTRSLSLEATGGLSHGSPSAPARRRRPAGRRRPRDWPSWR